MVLNREIPMPITRTYIVYLHNTPSLTNNDNEDEFSKKQLVVVGSARSISNSYSNSSTKLVRYIECLKYMLPQ